MFWRRDHMVQEQTSNFANVNNLLQNVLRRSYFRLIDSHTMAMNAQLYSRISQWPSQSPSTKYSQCGDVAGCISWATSSRPQRLPLIGCKHIVTILRTIKCLCNREFQILFYCQGHIDKGAVGQVYFWLSLFCLAAIVAVAILVPSHSLGPQDFTNLNFLQICVA